MTDQLVARRVLLPRLVRLRDAPFYLGMDWNRLNRDVRPYFRCFSFLPATSAEGW